MSKIYSIPEFSDYLKISKPKSEDVHIIEYGPDSAILLKSKGIDIDFYLLAIKLNFDQDLDLGQTDYDNANSLLYFDSPDKKLEWELEQSFSGYNILLRKNVFSKYVKEYNFMHYSNHEALFVNKDEESILLDLFKKAYQEYLKDDFSKEIILSYSSLILSYIHKFYNRQFETRSKIYNQVVSDFYRHLEDYFSTKGEVIELPSVAYFAEKSNLSPNYFGDVIKHFTGVSAIDHIHQNLIQNAKNKLRQTSLSISEIAYALGFNYPTYFTRFFKKETGITPSVFRKQ